MAVGSSHEALLDQCAQEVLECLKALSPHMLSQRLVVIKNADCRSIDITCPTNWDNLARRDVVEVLRRVRARSTGFLVYAEMTRHYRTSHTGASYDVVVVLERSAPSQQQQLPSAAYACRWRDACFLNFLQNPPQGRFMGNFANFSMCHFMLICVMLAVVLGLLAATSGDYIPFAMFYVGSVAVCALSTWIDHRKNARALAILNEQDDLPEAMAWVQEALGESKSASTTAGDQV